MNHIWKSLGESIFHGLGIFEAEADVRDFPVCNGKSSKSPLPKEVKAIVEFMFLPVFSFEKIGKSYDLTMSISLKEVELVII